MTTPPEHTAHPPSVDALAQTLAETHDLPHALLVDCARRAVADDPAHAEVSAHLFAREISASLVGDVINAREMVTIVRDRVQDGIKKGLTLEQVKTAKPTFDYDPLYGKAPGWGTDQFVEAVYKSLKGAK